MIRDQTFFKKLIIYVFRNTVGSFQIKMVLQGRKNSRPVSIVDIDAKTFSHVSMDRNWQDRKGDPIITVSAQDPWEVNLEAEILSQHQLDGSLGTTGVLKVAGLSGPTEWLLAPLGVPKMTHAWHKRATPVYTSGRLLLGAAALNREWTWVRYFLIRGLNARSWGHSPLYLDGYCQVHSSDQGEAKVRLSPMVKIGWAVFRFR